MRRGTPLLLALVLSLGSLTPAAAHDPAAELDRVRDELAGLNARIDQSKAESRQVGVELSAARDRLTVIQAELAEAQGRVDAVTARIATEEEQLLVLTGRLEAVQAELAETRRLLRSTQEDLEIQVVDLYMDASLAMGTLMLDFDSVSEAAVGIAYADGIASATEDKLDTFEFLKREEERQEELAEVRKAAVEEVLASLETERAELEQEAAEVEAKHRAAEQELGSVQTMLDRLRADISAAEQHKQGLEEDAARLERELAALQSKGGSKPGILAWPVNGRMSSPFGYRIHPILGTRRLHTGVDLSAGSGTPISAAGAGKVILAGPYGGYGNAVVIDHGGGLATLYAHQSSIVVRTGQQVATGEQVGTVGCTGFCTGPHLHFETRESGTPVDPMKYLGS